MLLRQEILLAGSRKEEEVCMAVRMCVSRKGGRGVHGLKV